MKISELREKTLEDLFSDLAKMQRELSDQKVEILKGKSKKVSAVLEARRDIARVQTVIREKQILMEIEK